MKHPYIPVLTGKSAEDFIRNADEAERKALSKTPCSDREKALEAKYACKRILHKSGLQLISSVEINARRVKAYKLILQ